MFSSKSRANLARYGSVVNRQFCQSTETEQENTVRIRQAHCIEWCKHMGINNPFMPDAALEDRNFAISCYLTFLALGQTINWQHIAYTAITKYFKAYKKLFADRTFIDTDGKEKKIVYRYKRDYVSVILTALKQYKSVKDHCYMISDRMMHILYKPCPDNSLLRALFDWIVLGRYTGFRQAQHKLDSNVSTNGQVNRPWHLHLQTLFFSTSMVNAYIPIFCYVPDAGT